jgi:hypothetical protein
MNTTSIRTRLLIAIAILATAGLLLPAAGMAAEPATGCTLATLSGPYGATLSGVEISGSTVTNISVNGLLVSNGAGAITSVTGTASLGGLVITGVTGNGTYTMNANCTGTATIVTSIQTFHISFTMISRNTSAFIIGADTGYVTTGQLNHQ